MSVFKRLQAKDMRNERRILWSEIVLVVGLALSLAAYLRFA